MPLVPSKSTGGGIREILLYQFLLNIKITKIRGFASRLKLAWAFREMWFLFKVTYEIKIMLFFLPLLMNLFLSWCLPG